MTHGCPRARAWHAFGRSARDEQTHRQTDGTRRTGGLVWRSHRHTDGGGLRAEPSAPSALADGWRGVRRLAHKRRHTAQATTTRRDETSRARRRATAQRCVCVLACALTAALLPPPCCFGLAVKWLLEEQRRQHENRRLRRAPASGEQQAAEHTHIQSLLHHHHNHNHLSCSSFASSSARCGMLLWCACVPPNSLPASQPACLSVCASRTTPSLFVLDGAAKG